MSSPSVYQRVLGARFAALHPGLRAYFGPVPEGMIGVGRGVFEVAGSRARILRPVFALMARRGILFPESAHDVPFVVENTPTPDGSLRATRRFFLPGVERRMLDRMHVDGERIIDRLGRRGGLETALEVEVDDGGLRLTSTSLALHIGAMRIALPRIARVSVDERWARGRQHVDVRIRMPLLGEVFRYRGSFTFAHRPAATATSSSATSPTPAPARTP